jgi:hypothetical protein
VEEWRSGGMEEWRNGGEDEWRNGGVEDIGAQPSRISTEGNANEDFGEGV